LDDILFALGELEDSFNAQLMSLHDETTRVKLMEDIMGEASALIEEGIQVTRELQIEDERAVEFADRASSLISKLNGSPNVSPNKDEGTCSSIGDVDNRDDDDDRDDDDRDDVDNSSGGEMKEGPASTSRSQYIIDSLDYDDEGDEEEEGGGDEGDEFDSGGVKDHRDSSTVRDSGTIQEETFWDVSSASPSSASSSSSFSPVSPSPSSLKQNHVCDISSQCHFMVDNTFDSWITMEMSVLNGVIRAHATAAKDVSSRQSMRERP
jgi:hypothetical protein